MTDRELLELAAKAYFAHDVADGVCSFWWDEKEESIVFTHGDNQDHNGCDVELLWIPLEEDGDALRLAVKLRLDVLWAEHEKSVVVCNDSSNGEHVAEKVRFTVDPAASTRRAIVRAAAEIGKAMQ